MAEISLSIRRAVDKPKDSTDKPHAQTFHHMWLSRLWKKMRSAGRTSAPYRKKYTFISSNRLDSLMSFASWRLWRPFRFIEALRGNVGAGLAVAGHNEAINLFWVTGNFWQKRRRPIHQLTFLKCKLYWKNMYYLYQWRRFDEGFLWMRWSLLEQRCKRR